MAGPDVLAKILEGQKPQLVEMARALASS